MKAGDWIVAFLKSKGVTNAFGLPGAVILEFLYAMERGGPEFAVHLNYHEQGAAFAACGYAQTSGRLGVAYSTRGPGLTNMLTAVADAYYDSIPIMFFTAHSTPSKKPGIRVLNNQEIDSVALVSEITKYAGRVDKVEDLQYEVMRAYEEAVSGRKGPVFLDISSAVFGQEIEGKITGTLALHKEVDSIDTGKIAARIRAARRPVFLIGNGIRQSEAQDMLRKLISHAQIPVLSSRIAQDIIPNDPMYFGFVGSHGLRYSNFILSKADLIVSLGNRLAFPINSKSFQPIMKNCTVVRVEIDENEYLREIPNSLPCMADLRQVIPKLLKEDLLYSGKKEWLTVCEKLKKELLKWDMIPVVNLLAHMMKAAGKETVFVCDVGNHSFWATNAYMYSEAENRILYSGSFGTLGSALPRAIGAYYGSKHPVICFTGDQGFQMNIQELQFISKNRLPITVVVLNNRVSGMIRDREKNRPHFLHTTEESGYGFPDFEKIASAYQMKYRRIDAFDDLADQIALKDGPGLIEIMTDEDTPLYPNLPLGNICQDLEPALPPELFNQLNAL